MPGGPISPMGGQDPCTPMNGQVGSPLLTPMNGNNGFGDNCGCEGMSVDTANNTIKMGNYTIAASPDAAGTLTVTDNCTGKSFKVWGDPHITTANGGTADFQQKSATFMLPNGALIHVQPTNNPTGPNTIQHVTVTYGNHAAAFDFSNGNVQTQDLPGQGYALDETTPAGVRIDATPNGQLAVENGTSNDIPIGPGTGNIDRYATNAPMGSGDFESIGNGTLTNGGNIAQFVNEITWADQAIASILQASALTRFV